MNLIGNNCVSSFLYEFNNEIFSSPFIWGGFDFNDFIYLISNYETINFSNISFSFEHRFNNKELNVVGNIDNKIKYHFSHYCYSEEESIPKIYKYRVFYKDIIEYVKEKYFKRLSRVKDLPIFLFSFNLINKDDKNYIKYLNTLLDIKDKKLIILIHESIKINKKVNSNIQIIQIKDNIFSTINANIIAKEVQNKIIY